MPDLHGVFYSQVALIALNVSTFWCTAGVFEELETLDLRGVFCSSQQSDHRKDGTLSKIIMKTGGRLSRLLIDNAAVGAQVALAVADRCPLLRELSMPCCALVTDRDLASMAAACKQLQTLCVGGPSK